MEYYLKHLNKIKEETDMPRQFTDEGKRMLQFNRMMAKMKAQKEKQKQERNAQKAKKSKNK